MKKKHLGKYIILIESLIILCFVVGLNFNQIKLHLLSNNQQSGLESETDSKPGFDDSNEAAETGSSNVITTTPDVIGEESEEPVVEATPEQDSEETQPPMEEEQDKTVNLSFVGDILLSQGVLNNYDRKGVNGILSKGVQQALKTANVAIANEEFPFSTRGQQAEDKQFTFRIPPKRVNVLQEMGIDVVTLGNNHALDFGTDALMDTFETLDQAQITYLGAGEDLERAKQIQYKAIDGLDIAFLGASRVIPVPEWNAGADKPGMLTTYDPTILLEQIKTAESNADFTVVYVHWGIERKEYPEDYQRYMAKQYIDAGADLVVGSHPHCLQGIEYYQGKPIVYSLGNFIFGTTIPRTAVLNATIQENGKSELSILPCTGTNFFTKELTNKNQKTSFYQYLQKISYGITIDENGIVHP